MPGVEKGTLLIADIGGYTNFLTAVELEHSTDILSDLIGAIVTQASGAFRLAKLEGDAVFCYAPVGAVDGPAFLTILESCYFAFVERLRNISRASTCDCGACRLTPSLNLKFVAHAGEYAIHEVAGQRELAGPDVITVHRLLKNHVVESTGKRGYAFMSAPVVELLGIDAAEAGLVAHLEHYDDVGDVGGFVLDLEASWQEHLREQRVFVGAEESIFSVTADLPAPPAVVWDWLNSPDKQKQWNADDMIGKGRNQRRGVGTVNHCVHGKSKVIKEVVDWKPFDYFSEINASGPMRMICTWELTAIGDAKTRLDFRVRPLGALPMRLALSVFGKPKFAEGARHIETLKQLLAAQPNLDLVPTPV